MFRHSCHKSVHRRMHDAQCGPITDQGNGMHLLQKCGCTVVPCTGTRDNQSFKEICRATASPRDAAPDAMCCKRKVEHWNESETRRDSRGGGQCAGWSHQTRASTTRMRRSAMRMRSINCFEAIHRETASPRDAPRIPVFRGCFAARLPMCVQELSSEQPRR